MPGVGAGQQSEPVYKGLFNMNCLDAAVQGLREQERERQRSDWPSRGSRFRQDSYPTSLPPLPCVLARRYERQNLELLRNRKGPACLSVFQRKPGAEACDV